MTNEMKLLRAFIEASGFDVEEVNVNPRRHDRYPSMPIWDYKVTRKEIKLPKLTDEEVNQLLDPGRSINGYVIHIKDDND